ncbi:MAG: ABC transporter [Candidatus Latescibacteria bacterium]|nr:ABC transporter [Candidatus Latescibacterota bacterium]
MNEWNWNGARWWKCDLHTHSPCSKDYGKGPNQESLQGRSPREWLLDYMRAEVDCIAITDHNTGAWFDRAKSALIELESESPDGFRPLHIFPGVEISVSGGTHLLAILADEKTTADIDSLLGVVGLPSEHKGSSDVVTKSSFVEVIEAIVEAGGIAIPAHVDGERGLFRRQKGTTLVQTLECKEIFAMELLDQASLKPQQYIDKKLHWTEILGSDAHHPCGSSQQQFPGSRFTWIKMGLPTIEGLRLALLDGSLSVCRSDDVKSDPNKHAPLAVECINVSKARFMGQSRSFVIGFNPWFNGIIGGRGTGKSTVVEFLRIVLRRKDELPKELQPELDQYSRIYSNEDDRGLLTDDTSLSVIFRKNGDKFRIQWDFSGDLEPIERLLNGQWTRTEGKIQERFPVRIYSQKQIFQLAKDPLALLRIIDEALEVGFQSWNERWRILESRFLSLRARAREITAGLAEEPRLRGELDDVKRKLDVFEQSGHAEILKSFQERSRQFREVEAWEESWIETGKRLREVAAEIVPDLLDGSTFDSDSESDEDFRKRAAETHNRLDNIRKSVELTASRADEVADDWQQSKDESTWKQTVDAALHGYKTLRENLSKGGAGDPAAFGELVQRRQVIEQRLTELDEQKKQIDSLSLQAKGHLNQLAELRRELTKSRRRFLNDVLGDNPYVQIKVVPYGAREIVEGKFRRLIQREDGRFERDIGSPDRGGLLGELYNPGDNAEVFEKNLVSIKAHITDIASGNHDTGTVIDRRFANHIGNLNPEVIDRLDSWFPEDSLEVRYSAGGDGQRFRSIQEGSPGQKTAALLAFLLSYGDEPLILDQPEDDLDNHLIYDLIVTQLRAIKLRRQVMVVTHNANIVVNGDAELVIALAARGGETQKECEGSLQEQQVRDTICAVMEGGRKAFEDRYRRIALDGHHV